MEREHCRMSSTGGVPVTPGTYTVACAVHPVLHRHLHGDPS